MFLLLAMLMFVPPASAADAAGGAGEARPRMKKSGDIQLGMSRAEVVRALEAMGGGRMESDASDPCATLDTVHFESNHVYSKGSLRFDRRMGKNCDIPVREDKLYSISMEFAAGLDGQVILKQHAGAFGKADKESDKGNGMTRYEWRKRAFSVALTIDRTKGTAVRREIDDLDLSREMKVRRKRGKEK